MGARRTLLSGAASRDKRKREERLELNRKKKAKKWREELAADRRHEIRLSGHSTSSSLGPRGKSSAKSRVSGSSDASAEDDDEEDGDEDDEPEEEEDEEEGDLDLDDDDDEEVVELSDGCLDESFGEEESADEDEEADTEERDENEQALRKRKGGTPRAMRLAKEPPLRRLLERLPRGRMEKTPRCTRKTPQTKRNKSRSPAKMPFSTRRRPGATCR
ncbi:DEAD/DEAH box RNA helicase family protein [Besnoitia besnoiti]|uniref:DEAD/DEAH box RNA helicase family protein n=1 Tax=Besnoitia besnoiti TaxID=94643 RepID=A0A2A9MMA3_BESBE|nr:DEAD/DEAH box RNA helicase family protein [Besnoitia besnoiti]PFH37531.1 DEAD/DEAH box RNA helicase family protein [Besnoitia besnoiti]